MQGKERIHTSPLREKCEWRTEENTLPGCLQNVLASSSRPLPTALFEKAVLTYISKPWISINLKWPRNTILIFFPIVTIKMEIIIVTPTMITVIVEVHPSQASLGKKALRDDFLAE